MTSRNKEESNLLKPTPSKEPSFKVHPLSPNLNPSSVPKTPSLTSSPIEDSMINPDNQL